MLFNSYVFLFCFLPFVLTLYFFLGRIHHNLALFSLMVSSLFFYGWWSPHYLILLLSSILFNYQAGVLIANHSSKILGRRFLFVGAILVNLLLLAYFKYTHFFLNNINKFGHTHFSLPQIILPLGISFFTFTQIAYLIDVYRNETKEYNLLSYSLFVTYFPHLIAGPIIHHKEIIPQFNNKHNSVLKSENIAIGITILLVGLFKKVILADSLQNFVDPVFLPDIHPAFFEAWAGAFAYSFQLYFDFSGYCDMAIGISLLFGIKLPLNFYSPYRAINIIDFWRRWHMTLSRFLKDYLYIPLGGNRKGKFRRYTNLMITMLLGGLWHGANWTFVVWGFLHGFYLAINHLWQQLFPPKKHRGILNKSFCMGLTFISVVFAWVFFRASNLTIAKNIIKGMVGINGLQSGNQTDYFKTFFTVDHFPLVKSFNFPLNHGILWIISLIIIIWLLPNMQQFFKSSHPTINSPKQEGNFWLVWQPNLITAVVIGVLGFLSILLLNKHSEFLYFQF